MHPITYSIILNLAILLAATVLSWHFAQPWVFVISVLLQTHALQRWGEMLAPDDEDDDNSRPIGFTADLNK